MLQSLFHNLFGCSHQRTTFPMTPARRISTPPMPGGARNGTYVVCLDCGKEFAYNWNEMRIGEAVSERTPAAQTQPMFR
jgi:hypothetical protein